MTPTDTVSANPVAEAAPLIQPEQAQVTPIVGKSDWTHAKVTLETSDVSESDAAVWVSGPRPSVDSFLERFNVQVTAELHHFPPPPDTAGLRKRFDALAKKWQRESQTMSSVTQMAMLPSYQQIIGLGSAAVPLILERLRQEPGHWFWALRAITRENPVPQKHAGRVRDMANDWIRWGRKNGFLI